MTDLVECEGDFKCSYCKTGKGEIPDKLGACREAELGDRIAELAFENKALRKKNERLQAENEQHQDIRDDMETLLKMIAEHLDVSDEPHQTWQERLLEALKKHTLIRKP